MSSRESTASLSSSSRIESSVFSNDSNSVQHRIAARQSHRQSSGHIVDGEMVTEHPKLLESYLRLMLPGSAYRISTATPTLRGQQAIAARCKQYRRLLSSENQWRPSNVSPITPLHWDTTAISWEGA